MRIALYNSEKDNRAKSVEVSWDELVQDLETIEETACVPCAGHSCPLKMGQAWSPVDIQGDGTRDNKNVVALTALVFDIDSAAPAQIGPMSQRLDHFGIACAMHSTHSFTREAPSLRLVIPLEEPFTREATETVEAFAARWVAFRASVIERFGIPADPATKDLARLYFFGTKPADGRPDFFADAPGAPLGLEVVGPTKIAPAPPQASVGPMESMRPTEHLVDAMMRGAIPLDLKEIKKALRSVKTAASREAMDALLRGDPAPITGGRDNWLQRIAGIVAGKLPDLPVEVFIQFVVPCLVPVCQPEGLDHWLNVATEKFERRSRELSELRAAEENQRAREIDDMRAIVAAKRGVEPKALAPVDLKWQETLDLAENGIRSTGANLATILRHEPAWKNVLRYNKMENAIEVSGGPVPQSDPEVLPTNVGHWFSNFSPTDYRMRIPTPTVAECLLAISLENQFDPLREHLLALEWDGVKRIDTWLQDYLHCPKIVEGEDVSEYVKRVGRLWLIGAAARGLLPGCKMDTVLILEGPEGIKKSQTLKILGGKWFSDTFIDMGAKDSKLAIARKWIVELAEIDSLKRHESSRQRAFLTQPSDQMRLPYGKVDKDFPRHCVFAGTTNPEDDEYEYLQPGINRRFWCVRCGPDIDIRGLEKVRDQLIAEAVAMILARENCAACQDDKAEEFCCAEHRHWLSKHEQIVANNEAARRVEDTIGGLDAQIETWWRSTIQSARPMHVTTSELAILLGANIQAASSRALQTALGRGLVKAGWKKIRKRNQTRFYNPPDEWLAFPYDQFPSRQKVENATPKVFRQ